jgi:hypothetical protein
VHENTTTTLIYHDLQDGGHNKERRFKMEPVFDPAWELKAGKSVIYQYFSSLISCRIV